MSTLSHIPTVTPEDLANFDQTHFSAAHHIRLSSNFLPPPPPGEVIIEDSVLEDDDGLGYYYDGQKRTLTDEQISMFRFSEVQELLRRKHRNNKRRQEHKDRKALRKLQEEESAALEAADRSRAEATAEQAAANPGVLPDVARRGRLEAAIWASSLEYDENLTGNRGKDVAPAAIPVPIQAPAARTVPSVGAGGKQFLWLAIAKE